MSESFKKVIQGSLLVRNALYSLIGQGLPIAAALISIPVLTSKLGIERFGVLTLAWMVTGYFSIFDLGISRAITKLVSEHLGKGEEEEIPSIVLAGLSIMIVVGIIGTVLLSSFSHYLVHKVLTIPAVLLHEAEQAIYLLAYSIPVVIIATCIRGVLEAYQRFDLINYIRVPVGISTFLVPLLIVQFNYNLEIIVAALIAVRFLELVASLVMCLKVIPKLRRSINIHGELLKSILSFGGWITISNVVGPLITYMDRFLIGALISISAVAYYTTTYEIVMRLMIIPGAVVGVMYPAFAATFNNNRDRSKEIYFKGVKYTLLMISPIILVLVTLANEGLLVWLGNEFASNSTTVLKLLAIGALINSQSYIPSALIQASGRPDLTAKLYFIELPIYLFLLIEMVNAHGIEGAAMTWVVRVTAEAIILSIIAFRLLKVTKISGNNCLLIVVFSIILIVSVIANVSIIYKIIFLIVVLQILGYISWSRILDPEERSFVSKKIARVFFH